MVRVGRIPAVGPTIGVWTKRAVAEAALPGECDPADESREERTHALKFLVELPEGCDPREAAIVTRMALSWVLKAKEHGETPEEEQVTSEFILLTEDERKAEYDMWKETRRGYPFAKIVEADYYYRETVWRQDDGSFSGGEDSWFSPEGSFREDHWMVRWVTTGGDESFYGPFLGKNVAEDFMTNVTPPGVETFVEAYPLHRVNEGYIVRPTRRRSDR
jgi:hypothetical protein